MIDNALDAGNPIPEALQSRAELRQKVRNSTDFKPLPAEIRSLFPSEFEETELGWVPEGWETNRLENILELAYGKALKKTERIEGDYPVYGSGGVDGSHNEFLVKDWYYCWKKRNSWFIVLGGQRFLPNRYSILCKT